MESIMRRIMSLGELIRLEEETEQLEDLQEKEVCTKLIEQIMDKVTEYNLHIREYAYKQALQVLIGRGIILEPVERKPVVTKWDKQIDSLVTAEIKRTTKYYSDQFRWHIFSFELLPALQGDQARLAFNSAEKSELYLFFDFADETYMVKNAQLLTADDVETLSEFSPLNYSDLYFFDPLDKWTYIKTHEDSCGPYFFKAA